MNKGTPKKSLINTITVILIMGAPIKRAPVVSYSRPRWVSALSLVPHSGIHVARQGVDSNLTHTTGGSSCFLGLPDGPECQLWSVWGFYITDPTSVFGSMSFSSFLGPIGQGCIVFCLVKGGAVGLGCSRPEA